MRVRQARSPREPAPPEEHCAPRWQFVLVILSHRPFFVSDLGPVAEKDACNSTCSAPAQVVVFFLARSSFPSVSLTNSSQLQAVTEKDMYADICHAPLDFESSPWDSLSGGRAGGCWMRVGRGLVGVESGCRCGAVRAVESKRAAPIPAAVVSTERLLTPPPPPPPRHTADARDFVAALLNRDEKQRPTAEQALQHRCAAGGALHTGWGGGSRRGTPLQCCWAAPSRAAAVNSWQVLPTPQACAADPSLLQLRPWPPRSLCPTGGCSLKSSS